MDTYLPIVGKTYTLFGKGDFTGDFYETISCLADALMAQFCMTEEELLPYIRNIRKKKWLLIPRLSRIDYSFDSTLRARLHRDLSEFVPLVEDHLKTVPVYKFLTDKRLLTNRTQYYLYMVEFELVNRINKRSFLESAYKIALLPYCLRETQTHCRATTDGIDFICQGCRKNCYINAISDLLRHNDIKPYIWRQADLNWLFRKLIKVHGSLGVLGIACIVELVAGMRLCIRKGLPVVGIPLNANRCIRWTDGFYENSVDMGQLEKLLDPMS